VTTTGEARTSIQGHVVKINEYVHSIAIAAKEQSTGLSEVSVAVNLMDQVTQQNAAMVEETTAATNRLADEAGMSPSPNSADGLVGLLSSQEGRELNLAFRSIADPRVRRTFVALVKSLASEADRKRS
jgi:methyl-accepting chemotaxis protein